MDNEMKAQPKCYRQGELIFIPCTVTKEQREFLTRGGRDMGRNIREGEVSGHIHAINAGTLIELPQATGGYYQDGARFEIPRGEMFLTSDHQIKITHPEHDTLPLDHGDYVIRVQREYDETRDRQVLD